MSDKGQPSPSSAKSTSDGTTPASTPAVPPRRGPGHRGADVRDTVAEMAARAQEISQEAGSKVAAAMKDVINAAAGLATFAVESARDLVQYMVRRGQMTQEEADKLIREAEEAASKRKGAPRTTPAASAAIPSTARPTPRETPSVAAPSRPASATRAAPAAKAPAAKKAKAKAAPKAKAAAKKPAARKPAAKAAKKGSKKK